LKFGYDFNEDLYVVKRKSKYTGKEKPMQGKVPTWAKFN